METNTVRAEGHRIRRGFTNGLLGIPALFIGVSSAVVDLNVSLGPAPMVFVNIVVIVIVFFVFAVLMRRPTGLGRNVLDSMLGFREFLEITEKNQLNLRNPPERTPQLFEKYLLFALATGVEQKWAERFTEVFAGIRGPNNATCHPSWYNGARDSIDLSANTAGLRSALSLAIRSSVTPPGRTDMPEQNALRNV